MFHHFQTDLPNVDAGSEEAEHLGLPDDDLKTRIVGRRNRVRILETINSVQVR